MGVHIGHFLNRREAFGGQQLGQRLVDVEGGDEEIGAGREFLLAALGLFGFGHDVDVPAGELGGEAHVLAAAADGERQLLVRHHDFDALGFFIEHDLGDFGGGQRVHHEGGDVLGPLDDVDLFALQLVDDSLNTAAAHADTGTDRIDGTILGAHGDLGAAARVAGNGDNLDHAVVDFRHFLAEQAGHELRVRARQEDLGTALLAAHVIDIGADTVARTEGFARQRFIAADDAFATAEVDDDVAIFDALHRTMNDLADAVLVFGIHPVALGIAHLLHDHLLGILRGDAPELDGRQGLGDLVADVGGRIAALRIDEADLGRLVLDLLDDEEQALQAGFARARVDLGDDLVLGTIAGLGGLLDRLFHRMQHDRLVDRLLARHGVCNLQQLQPVSAHAIISHCRLRSSLAKSGLRRSRRRRHSP